MPPQTPEDTSALESLKERLYAPNAPAAFPAPTLSEHAPPLYVAPIPAEETHTLVPEKKKLPLSVWFLLVAGIFFVLASGTAAYFLLFGGRSISTDNVEVSVANSPVTAKSGDPILLAITIKNQNPTNIIGTVLSAEFPEGTLGAEGTTTLIHYSDTTVGDVAPGASVTRTVNARFFGSENTKISVPVHIEYRTEGSASVFVKDTTFDVTITSSPLSITAEVPAHVAVGQPFTLPITVTSTANQSLQHVALQVVYPFGFTPSASMKDGPLFTIGTLAPGERKTISISGVLSGDNGSTRVFRMTAGTKTDDDALALAVPYASTQTDLSLSKPFLSTTLSINHDTGPSPVVAAGTSAQGMVTWVNTLPTSVINGEVTIQLKGDALDPASVLVSNGFYRSVDSTIIFNAPTVQGLSLLDPGATGSGSFTFSTKTGTALTNLRQPTITATISVSGKNVNTSNTPQNISSTLTRTILVGTNTTLATRMLHTSGPIPNSGPYPPAPNKETTYTVQMRLANTVNSVGGATVSVTLPLYVRYTGVTSPSDGSITYDEAKRMVTWKAGEVPAGTGISSKEISASFQIAFLPSVSQRGGSPMLIGTQTLTGTDKFTQKTFTSTVQALDSSSVSDPGFLPEQGRVQQ